MVIGARPLRSCNFLLRAEWPGGAPRGKTRTAVGPRSANRPASPNAAARRRACALQAAVSRRRFQVPAGGRLHVELPVTWSNEQWALASDARPDVLQVRAGDASGGQSTRARASAGLRARLQTRAVPAVIQT